MATETFLNRRVDLFHVTCDNWEEEPLASLWGEQTGSIFRYWSSHQGSHGNKWAVWGAAEGLLHWTEDSASALKFLLTFSSQDSVVRNKDRLSLSLLPPQSLPWGYTFPFLFIWVYPFYFTDFKVSLFVSLRNLNRLHVLVSILRVFEKHFMTIFSKTRMHIHTNTFLHGNT